MTTALPLGEMRQRVEIQARAQQQDQYGAPVHAWSTIATRWAAVRPMTAQELPHAQQQQANVTHEVSMRFFETLTPEMRLRWNGKLLNIERVLHTRGMTRSTVVHCKEVV